MNGIQQIGLTHSVVAKETVHLRRKGQFRLQDILIIEHRKLFQYHFSTIEWTKIKNIVRNIDYIGKKNYFCALNCGKQSIDR